MDGSQVQSADVLHGSQNFRFLYKGPNMPKPGEVKPLDSCRLRIKFSDGVEGVVGLSEFAGKGVFERWNDYCEFQKVHIGPDGEIAWSDENEISGVFGLAALLT